MGTDAISTARKRRTRTIPYLNPEISPTAGNRGPLKMRPTETGLTQPGVLKVIEGLFVQQRAIRRHLNMPMLDERQAYLAHLLELGRNRKYVIDVATLLCHVIRHILPSKPPLVSEADISRASLEWVSETPANMSGRGNRTGVFKAAARSWFRFIGRYEFRPREG